MMSKAHRSVPLPVRRSSGLAVAPFEGFDRSSSQYVPQELIDEQLAGFTEGELKVALAVARATNGGQRESVPISVRTLCEGGVPDVLPGRGTGLSPRTVQAASASLETAGFVRMARRMAPDGSGLPSLFSLPLIMPALNGTAEATPSRFPGYAAGRRIRLPLLVIDKLMAELSGTELKVLLYVLRHTFCAGIPDTIMPMARLVENTGLSLRHTRQATHNLAARGIIEVQRRQDAERGKLPSAFGVRVIGEPAPFAPLPAHGAPARPRAEEPSEPGRPVWLVPPTAEPAALVAEPPTTPILAVLPASPSAGSGVPPAEAWPVLAKPLTAPPRAPQVAVAPPAAIRDSVPPTAGGTSSAQRSASPVQRAIPAAALRDQNPIWAATKRILAEKLPYHYYMERVAATSSLGGGGSELLIAVQNEHHRWWMESKLGSQVREALAEAGYPDQRIRYLNFTGVIKTDGDRSRE